MEDMIKIKFLFILITLWVISGSLAACSISDDHLQNPDYGQGDCSHSTVIGVWRQTQVINVDDDSVADQWKKEDMLFYPDCRIVRVEYEGERADSDQGYFRQMGQRVQTVMSNWTGLVAIVNESEMTLRSPKYKIIAQRTSDTLPALEETSGERTEDETSPDAPSDLSCTLNDQPLWESLRTYEQLQVLRLCSCAESDAECRSDCSLVVVELVGLKSECSDCFLGFGRCVNEACPECLESSDYEVCNQCIDSCSVVFDRCVDIK